MPPDYLDCIGGHEHRGCHRCPCRLAIAQLVQFYTADEEEIFEQWRIGQRGKFLATDLLETKSQNVFRAIIDLHPEKRGCVCC